MLVSRIMSILGNDENLIADLKRLLSIFGNDENLIADLKRFFPPKTL